MGILPLFLNIFKIILFFIKVLLFTSIIFRTKMNKQPPSPFTYLDFRRFLEDAFAFRQAHNPKFSLRAFSKLAGYSTPNFLKLVTEGKLNLNPETVAGTARALGLNKKEQDFFESLTWFNQAKDHETKNRYFEKLLKAEPYRTFKILGASQYRYFSHWYNPVIRELVVHPDFDGSPAWIAKRIFPAITVPQAKKSLALLKELNLVQVDASGTRWHQTDLTLATESEAASLALMNFHKAMLSVSLEALQHFPSSRRDFRCLTVSLSPSDFRELKSRFEDFWRETLLFANRKSNAANVYQINMQVFPLMREPEEDNV